MKRDLNLLADQHFDVLIIGGGIHGAWIAHEASLAGLKTALIEQKDFSNATSANSLKILHGGLRYLQSLDFKRMRASIRSQTEFMRIAPHLVTPLGCLIPTYGFGVRGKTLMRMALLINDLIGWDRNQQLGNRASFSRGKIISAEDFSKIVPINSYRDFNGAAIWFDALVQDTERLTLTVLSHAYAQGACVANYVKATELITADNHAAGVYATDAFAGEQLKINANTVVNATGPWLENTLKSLPNRNRKDLRLARGLNIVVKKRLFKDYAIGLEGSRAGYDNKSILGNKKRFYFFVPWRGCTMIGTGYQRYDGNPNKLEVNRQDIEEFINEVNHIYPPAELTIKDVTFYHAGLLPAAEKNTMDLYDIPLAKHSEVINHEKRDGIKGLISVLSVKYTTAPFVAQKVLKEMGVSAETGEYRQTVYRNSHNPDWPDSPAESSEDNSSEDNTPALAVYLRSKYGKYADRILNYIEEDNRLASWISREPPLIAAEVLYAIREEMALHLSDIVFRRTGFGNAACPSRLKLEALADFMALELGWDSQLKAAELLDVCGCYHPLPVSEKFQEKKR